MLRGLNWGHRRARAPMDALARALQADLGLQVVWDQQTLGGFEHGLTASLAKAYDLIVFDHPFCGDIAAGEMFLPLDAWCSFLDEDDWIGRSLQSYRYEGKLWGLPVDGATQACIYRPDLLDDGLPVDCDGVLALAGRLRRRDQWMVLPALAPPRRPRPDGVVRQPGHALAGPARCFALSPRPSRSDVLAEEGFRTGASVERSDERHRRARCHGWT